LIALPKWIYVIRVRLERFAISYEIERYQWRIETFEGRLCGGFRDRADTVKDEKDVFDPLERPWEWKCIAAMTHELALLPQMSAGAYEQCQLSTFFGESFLPKARLTIQF
jgi:hypothetical protein